MWKPAIESSPVDGDLTVPKHEREHTLLSLEARVVDRADHERSAEQFTMPAKAHRADDFVTKREAARRHVHLMLVAGRGRGCSERQRPSGFALGRADSHGAN